MNGFDAARRAALMQDLIGHLTGRPVDLLPFDRVRASLRLKHVVDGGVRDVPIDQIVGSVDRGREFTRAFLPREEALRERWEDLHSLAAGAAGFSPVELYRIGEAYFVIDGHHRVSVARSLGSAMIEARVLELVTPFHLSPEESLEEVLLKSGHAAFLETTGLPSAAAEEVRITLPDGYPRLVEHIEVHRYYRGLEGGREVSWDEAVESWYETVFRPMIGAIRNSGVLAEFPGRTEADLYLFAVEHLQHLRERYAPKVIEPGVAVRHFRWFYRPHTAPRHVLRDWWRKIRRLPEKDQG